MKSFLVILPLFVALVSGNPFASREFSEVKKPIVPIMSFVSSSDNRGSYSIEHQSGDGTRMSESGSLKPVKDQMGSIKSGSYSWISPEGRQFSVSYTADEFGFHPVADHLPKAPPMPEEIAKMLPLLPKLKEDDASYGYGTKEEEHKYSNSYSSSYAPAKPLPVPTRPPFVQPPAPVPTFESFPVLVGPPAPVERVETPEYSIHLDPSRTFVRIGQA